MLDLGLSLKATFWALALALAAMALALKISALALTLALQLWPWPSDSGLGLVWPYKASAIISFKAVTSCRLIHNITC